MITFSCPRCQRTYTVPEAAAGRSANCRCGTQLLVPKKEHAAAPVRPTTPPKNAASALPMRTRRLMADAQQMKETFEKSAIIQIRSAVGDPPEEYVIDYQVRGLERGKGGQPVARDQHAVRIQLTSDYPRLSPACRMITPVFHPNIDPATICVGDHWAAGERLVDLVVRIGEMLGYQAYNIKSPLDAEAAMWADLNTLKLPTDSRDMHPDAKPR